MARDSVLLAEWAPQSGVLLTWPHDGGDWGSDLDAAEACFASIVGAISDSGERVVVVVRDADHRAEVSARLGEACQFAVAPSDDSWARDHGPITVLRQGRPMLLDFTFNGWGEKYPHGRDDAISRRLHAEGVFGDTPLVDCELVVEGGALETDGEGTLLTTARWATSTRRNGCSNTETFSRKIKQFIDFKRIIFLEYGAIHGDDTDGHIDTLARFYAPEGIVFQSCDDPDDPNYPGLRALAAELEALRTAAGQPYRLVPLPLPRPRQGPRGEPLPAVYVNFLIVNAAVLVPVYADPVDAEACRRLATCFPAREIIPVDCRALVRQFGSLHCAAMQLPAGVLGAARRAK